MLAVPGTTFLRKVTVRTSEPDALAVRTQFERAMALVDLHPASLPRSAILCVRALRDCSRRLSFRATPDFAALNRWRQTTVAALDTLARGAARPSRGPVPATAEAVLFADETELLACLALDWCRGRFAEHWWWRGLFANRPCPSWTAAWLEKPEFIPAAVELVAEQQEVDSLARNVASAEARQLLAAVVERFGLREVAVVLSRAEGNQPRSKPGWRKRSRRRQGMRNFSLPAWPLTGSCARHADSTALAALGRGNGASARSWRGRASLAGNRSRASACSTLGAKRGICGGNSQVDHRVRTASRTGPAWRGIIARPLCQSHVRTSTRQPLKRRIRDRDAKGTCPLDFQAPRRRKLCAQKCSIRRTPTRDGDSCRTASQGGRRF